MRKLMEVYESENGLIFKKEEKVFHLFSGVETKETTDSVRIADAYDAFNFLAEFFADKLKIDQKEMIMMERFDRVVQFRLMLEEPLQQK